mgnify:CR=1 FL=1
MNIRPFRDIKRRKTKKIKVGKVEVGGDVALTESLELYGEVEMRTGPLNDYGTKIGLQYNF